MNLPAALSGAVPALVAMWYFDRLDAARPEPRSSLRRVAIAGGVSVIPCAVIELILQKSVQLEGIAAPLFTAFVVAAGVEELAKVLCVRWFIWKRREFDERMDGIVYATRAGLGFALVENILYLVGATTVEGFAWMWIGRAILSVPGHAIFAGMMGYFAARKRFDNVGPGLLGGYAVAVTLHGVYDAALFCAPYLVRASGKEWIGLVLFAVPVLVVVGGGITLRRMAREAISLDHQAESLAHPRVALL